MEAYDEFIYEEPADHVIWNAGDFRGDRCNLSGDSPDEQGLFQTPERKKGIAPNRIETLRRRGKLRRFFVGKNRGILFIILSYFSEKYILLL